MARNTRMHNFLRGVALVVIPPCVLFVTLSLFITQALALGISPQMIAVHHNETTRGTAVPFSLRSIPTGGEVGVVAVRAEGDLSSNIQFDSRTVLIGDPILGTILLPQELSPGDHPQDIIITLSSGGNNTVNANLEIAATLLVQVPYPESYLSGTLTANPVGDTTTQFVLMLQNLGTVPTTPELITLNVLDSGKKVDELFMIPPEIPPATFAKTSEDYNGVGTGVITPGEYTVQASVSYAQQELLVRKDVTFGSPVINITRVAYASDERGTIRPIDIAGTVRWNRPLNATIRVFIDNRTEPSITSVVPANNVFSTRLYVDTAVTGVPAQNITVQVSVLDSDAQRTVAVGTGPGAKTQWVLWALALIALLMGLFFFIDLLRARRR